MFKQNVKIPAIFYAYLGSLTIFAVFVAFRVFG
jgi:hypothetical protein